MDGYLNLCIVIERACEGPRMSYSTIKFKLRELRVVIVLEIIKLIINQFPNVALVAYR